MRGILSVLFAAALLAGLAYWMLTGHVIVGGQPNSGAAMPPPTARQEAQREPFKVRFRTVSAEPRVRQITVRGRTEAEARVEVHAETRARVLARLVEEGAPVATGDPLCRLDPGSREARVLEARARLAQVTLDFEAATQLVDRGFTPQTRVAALKAEFDAAEALLKEFELELDRTTVRAPINGVVESPMAQIGTTLAIGDVCAVVVDSDPMIAVGQVSEQTIAQVSIGMRARVQIIGGHLYDGRVRYVSPTADPATRTYRIEAVIENPDSALKDGMTAQTFLDLPPVDAHRLRTSMLTLDDDGTLGVRTVNTNGYVQFNPVSVLDSDADGIWVTGLPITVDIISVGQEYVVAGEKVTPIPDDREDSSV